PLTSSHSPSRGTARLPSQPRLAQHELVRCRLRVDLESHRIALLVLDQMDSELLVILLDRQMMGGQDVVVEELPDAGVRQRDERVDEGRVREGPALSVSMRQLDDEVLQSPMPVRQLEEADIEKAGGDRATHIDVAVLSLT